MTKGGLVGGLLPKPMVIQTPGSTANAQTYCHDIPIVIQGETFLSDLVILETQGIDIILGMNWLANYHGRIDCAKRVVTLTTDQGT